MTAGTGPETAARRRARAARGHVVRRAALLGRGAGRTTSTGHGA